MHLDFTHSMQLSSDLVHEIQKERKVLVSEIDEVPKSILYLYLKVREDLFERRNVINSRFLELQSHAIQCLQ